MRLKKLSIDKNQTEEREDVFEWIGESTLLSNGYLSYEAVRRNKETFYKGDCVLVHNDTGKGSWAAMITRLYQTSLGEKMADLLWFERSDHIRREKRRFPTSHSELLICGTIDPNELSVFQWKIEVISYEAFIARYPQGLTKKMNDYDRVFYCRSGFHSIKEIYLDFIDWDQLYRQQHTDFNALVSWVETTGLETSSEKKYKRKSIDERKAKKMIINDNEDQEAISEQDLDSYKSDMYDFYVPISSDDESEDTMITEESEYSSDSLIYKTPSKKNKSTLRPITPTSSIRQTGSNKRRRYKKFLETTPLPLRYLSCNESEPSPYQSARSKLHVSTIPTGLPCREKEFSLIYSQVLSALEAGHGECIYVSGTPGTGKTVTIKEVIKYLFQKVDEGEIDDFKFLEINGMRIIEANQAYTLLWEALTGERVTAKHALMLLEKRFSQPNLDEVPCVVMMDELDQLVTKDQKLMYNFFNWPTLHHSRLIIIAVANTMDLPERMLTNKISSRLGLTRIGFAGYTFDQLRTIIKTRLQGISNHLMDQDAIELASRKVSAVSGDARRALDICRRAVEIAEASAEGSMSVIENEHHGKVTMKTIHDAIAELSSSPVQMYLRTMPLVYKVFLVSLMLKMKRTGVAEHRLSEIMDTGLQMCKVSEKIKLQELCNQTYQELDLNLVNAALALAEAGILFLNMKGGKRYARVQLKITQQDVKMALQNDTDFKGAV